MSKKFLDDVGLTLLCKKFQEYPDNEILGTVINVIDQQKVNKSGDTMGGKLVANSISVKNLETAQVRNIFAGTANISEVENYLNIGDIYLQFEE